MSEEERKRKRKLKIETLASFWKKQLQEVQLLRSPTGNWNLLKGLHVLPAQKVQGYFQARKRREKKCTYRILACLKQLEELES